MQSGINTRSSGFTQGASPEIEHWHLSKSAVCSASGMVAAQHMLAAQAGGDVLRRGGNAIDAAIAAALALGVVEPWMCGLGGSGLMVVWLAEQQQAYTLDFQGVLAANTRHEDYPVDGKLPQTLMGFPTVKGEANVRGYRSITVPGAAAGFDHAVNRWGRLSLSESASPALALARHGVRANWFTTLQSALEARVIASDHCTRQVFLPDGHPIQPGALYTPDTLHDTLKQFADSGAEGFYRGDLAQSIVRDLRQGGSPITEADFAAYRVLESTAAIHDHRGTECRTPGDGSGGTRLGDFLRHVAQHLPHPPTQPDPASWCLYADALNSAWRAHNARIGRGNESNSCTSHLSTVDSEGNMVALTHTLLNRFGSGVTLPSTGLMMNNSVSYFDPRPGYPTSMQPSMRINASNMCPVIGIKGGKARFALGASGGNHIMPAVAQVAALMLDFDMSFSQAMHHPRLDASDRNSVRADPALGDAVLGALAERHTLEVAQQMVFPKLYACVSGVASTAEGYVGLNDPSQPMGGASGPCAFNAPLYSSQTPDTVHA